MAPGSWAARWPPRAAFGLTAGAGIPAVTIHRLLNTAAGDDLDERRVLVVDECGMVGTRQLAAVLELADHSGAKVVLVGDHRQLPRSLLAAPSPPWPAREP